MPDDGIEFTCKYLFEGECWRYDKPIKCSDQRYEVMRKCEDFKKQIKR
jgi:hypothetical protein